MIEIVAADLKVGSSTSVKLTLVEVQYLRSVLESKEMLGRKRHKLTRKFVEKRRKEAEEELKNECESKKG